MQHNKWNTESITSKLTFFVIALIIIQTILLVVTLILGGVLEQGRENAYQFFSEKVNNRRRYIEREMKNRWTNIDPYLGQLARSFSEAEQDEEFFADAAPDLISMLRTVQTTGAFIILESQNEEHPAFYVRDYDPSLASGYDNKDLYLIAGSPDLARKLEIPLERNWSYNLALDKSNQAFYNQPYNHASLSSDAKFLGYWSNPFRLSENDLPIITYTRPFFDADNQLQGVIGVEISLNYLKDLLPRTELKAKESLGYLIGYKGGKDKKIRPLITVGALQERILHKKEPFSFHPIDKERNIYLLKNHESPGKIYADVEKMGLYNYNTPFQAEKWYLIGLMPEDSLLNYVQKIQQLLWISLFVSILLGGAGGILISYRFTKPITRLAQKVEQNDEHRAIELETIGLAEVDQLAQAIEVANNDLVEKIEEITELSETDQLTGIYNRVKFSKELEKEIERKERYQTELSLIMFDVDHFKKVNDTYGHDRGDQALIELTSVVSRLIRETDIFARWGGEEFMILTPNTDLSAANKLAERIREEIAKVEIEEVGHITCSFGVTDFKREDDFDKLTKRVDDALYEAKNKGRDRVVSI